MLPEGVSSIAIRADFLATPEKRKKSGIAQILTDISGRLPLLSTRPAVTPQPLRGLLPILLGARWVWTVCLRLLSDSVATAIWTRGAEVKTCAFAQYNLIPCLCKHILEMTASCVSRSKLQYWQQHALERTFQIWWFALSSQHRHRDVVSVN